MLKKIAAFVKEKNMFQTSDRIVVGISGGADSVCLLCVLIELQSIYHMELRAVHINHGIRGEAAKEDELFVKRFCEKRKIPLEIYQEHVAQRASKEKLSEEEAGRVIRRERFEYVANQWGGAKIALAHHQNDQAETMIFNISRGAGLKGAGGIRAVNGQYVRPLLCVERREIELYLKQMNITYCIDCTNKEDIYTRNKIRNHIIPYIETSVNQRFVSCVSEMAEQMQAVETYMEKQTKRAYEHCIDIEETKVLKLRKREWEKEDAVIRQRVIYLALCMAAAREKDIEAIHVKSIMELFQKQVGKEVHLPYNLKAIRGYEEICIKQKEEKLKEKEKPYTHMQVMEKARMKDAFVETPYTKWFDYDIIKNTVEIRGRKQGDYITINRQGHTQKLKKFFINEKVPQEERDAYILIADGNHIIWIVGLRTNPAYKVTEGTKRVLVVEEQMHD